MSDRAGWLGANRANWNERAAIHAARDGSGYQVQDFVDNGALLSDVVSFDLPVLGDIAGKNAVHLQCHIGTDTISLARLGAVATGLDFSQDAIREARTLAAETGDVVTFVEADVHDAAKVLPCNSFDLVYTGIGALCWLPRVDAWSEVVSALLAPGGALVIREGHPILWSIDDSVGAELCLRYPYFEHDEPLEWDDGQTYVPTDKVIQASTTYEWNHSLGEIVTALIASGLRLDLLIEHDSVPWEALPGHMAPRPGGEWALSERSGVMPLTYTIKATKPA
ncbi:MULTISPECIES: bifunctional 2-polyprenyl-6-hydroxyphenol methylase/3-demethylubiquinol 3-O-methyltransferase UbiG [Mycobacteroides]|uniref:Methyltransferase n=1 Tax=Mycobacteroides chelonae TaxID=1774 RepID=A0A1S1LPL3_MYCCH|nr:MULTISPECIES: class I SAM-dependent methyltransferase [Mycobacteroides]KRQ22592.1 methyltransferase [Mycobacteroides sp. H092]KRQ24455.1 methyltransferase [Mycobacteroides sp. H003]KRQ40080.1 methyltransferase [Mycobacteroides sp. H101]KRQ47002.1 methyltransferase [Mycobacteroides sp. H063]KRQ58462.1 methyltransferase [Mycobacteroides sp. HXVII]